jgi:ABC-2 type transport system permease protein
MREILVAPISKTEIAIGKMLGAISRGLIQGILILMVAPFLHISLSVSTIGLCLLFIILISTGMAGLGIMVSSQISRMETFSLIMQFIVAPLVFLSGAFFPIEKIPQ